ncbi:NAD(P)H-dependent oxidoreductase [Rhodococcus sovatensis]|uniref:NAD(P)H-dependent oxidoreductase n=1 Tax=Rhodococcus sovatensis TaxID=1805840 RepID=A0ABZ2PQR4_9NOCA
MTTSPIELAVVVGSVRPGRLGPTVAEWFLRIVAERPEFVANTIDLIDLNLPADLSPSPGADTLAAGISSADAVVLVTPEYNHGYPGSLKNALDIVKYEWRGKPVGFVSYGGLYGGARAVEQLRQVAAELHMVSVRDSVGFPRARKTFGPDPVVVDGPAADSAARMLDQLHWWATAATTQRALRSYPGQ